MKSSIDFETQRSSFTLGAPSTFAQDMLGAINIVYVVLLNIQT
jgi:hypothetical protein